jgi:hypothetical protein
MSAQIIALRGAESLETPQPLCPPLHARSGVSLGVSGRHWWHRTRLTVEALGWIIVAASIIAAVKG